MTLENGIKDAIQKKLEDGTVERIIEENFEKAIKEAAGDLFSWRGSVKEVIEEQIKSVMVPYIEEYDFSSYITKLDHVLTEVMKHSLTENKKLLENFSSLMIPIEKKTIKTSELYEQWMKYVAEDVDVSELEVDLDDEPSYETVDVSLEVEHAIERSWMKMEKATVIFECEQDESLNIAIPIHRFTDISKDWTIDYKTSSDLNGLRHLNSFEVFLMKLDQNFIRLEIDTHHESDEVTPEEIPEPSY